MYLVTVKQFDISTLSLHTLPPSSLTFLLIHYIHSCSVLTILFLSLSPCASLCSSGSMVSGWRWLWMTGCQYAKAVCSSATLTPATSIGAPWWRRPMPSQLPLPAYVSGLQCLRSPTLFLCVCVCRYSDLTEILSHRR